MSSDDPVPPPRPLPVTPRGLSRRNLLALSALSAAAPLSGLVRTTPAAADGSADAAYQKAFQQAVAADRTVRRHTESGREFLYRARQLLAANADAQRVAARLRQYGYPVGDGGTFAGVTRLVFAQEVEVPALVTRLRDPAQWPNQSVPKVQPHHVLVGSGNIMGNPGGPPEVAAALPAPDLKRAKEGAGVTVGICDTGIWPSAAAVHPQWLGGCYLPEIDDEDSVYLHDDVLATQGGHGTFVAGVVRQAAPGVRFDPEQALDRTGLGDEAQLVAAMSRLDPAVSIINLSLGGFTQGDVPPLPLVNALAALPTTTAVVAAAGNTGISRPTWPAALDTVLAVASVRNGASGLEPTPDSGHGPWVDACALGEWTSTYVTGQLLLPGLAPRLFAGFATWSGTSFATAYVSGRLAALMTANGLTARDARLALLAQPRWQPDYGVLV